MNATCYQREQHTHKVGKKEYRFLHTQDTKYPPPVAWRYQCQSTQCTITIKCAIYGTCDPCSIFTTAEGMTALNLQGEEVCVYILSHQSLSHTIQCYVFVVCMLSYLAYLDDTQQCASPLHALPTAYV